MNTANKITLIRIALVPLFIILWKIPSELCHWLAAATFVVAALTDGVAGYVARHAGDVPDWVTVVILAREFMVTSLRTVAVAQNVVIAASIWGKVKTVVQIILVVAIMVLPDYPVFEILKQILIYAALIITVLSGADYMWKNRACIKAE